MDDCLGIVFVGILALVAIAFIIYVLFWITVAILGATISVGVVSGAALAFKCPFSYLSKMWRRCH